MHTYTATSAERPTTATWGWIAIAFASLAISVPADPFIMVGFTEMCGQTPDAIDVLHSLTAGAWTSSLCLGG